MMPAKAERLINNRYSLETQIEQGGMGALDRGSDTCVRKVSGRSLKDFLSYCLSDLSPGPRRACEMWRIV
jgi:hypothetical protein